MLGWLIFLEFYYILLINPSFFPTECSAPHQDFILWARNPPVKFNLVLLYKTERNLVIVKVKISLNFFFVPG